MGLGIAEVAGANGVKVVTPITERADKVEFSSVKFEG